MQSLLSAPSAPLVTEISPLDALAAELGADFARVERELRREFAIGMAEVRQELEALRRQAAENELRAVNAERALAESVRERLALVRDGQDGEPGTSVTIEDVRPLVSDEVARQIEAAPKPPDQAAFDAAIAAEVDRRLNEIVARAADIARPEPVQIPDVAALVADEITSRAPEIAERAAALVPIPEIPALPDVSAMVGDAVASALAVWPVPENGKSVAPAEVRAMVVAEVERAFVDLPAPEAGHTPTDDELRPLVEDAVGRAVAELPKPQNSRDADPEATAMLVQDELAKALAAQPAVLDRADVVNIVAAEIAEARAEWPSPVDVATAVVAEIDGRAQEIAVRAAALVPLPEPGKSVTVDDVRPVIALEVERQVADLPEPEAGPKGDPGAPGKLPVVRAWADEVHYEASVVTHEGALWQAVRDTGRAPPHEDWICLAAPGRDGADGRSFTIRGTHSPEAEYKALDVVALNGASFAARMDDPGPCPGDGWQLMASQGKPGRPGERGVGMKGDPGPPGPPVRGFSVDGDGVLTLRNGDGSTVACDLYPLLDRLGR